MKLLNHRQSKPNPNQTTATICYHQAEQSHGEKGGPRREKQKAKRILGPALFFTGLLSPFGKGIRRDLILARASLVDSLKGILWGRVAQPTPSVTCR